MKLAPWRTTGWRSRGLHRLVDALGPRSPVVRRGGRGTARVALTFDDGPDERTGDYLAVLAEYGVHATFFVIGEAAARHPEAIARIAAGGHELAVHGFTHRPFPDLTGPQLTDELARTSALLPGARLVRPPRGAVSLRSLVTCARVGFKTVLWSLDSHDCRTTSPAEIAATVARSRLGEIVLLHEGQDWTLSALPRILASLGAAGLTAVTASQLLRD
jgi:peptidoglycan/xylan/chitin deacetylase (PgdA/CDA1 family)